MDQQAEFGAENSAPAAVLHVDAVGDAGLRDAAADAAAAAPWCSAGTLARDSDLGLEGSSG